jgi:hydroxyacyl-ACP dehydratase HTD2-like protein with hotdog domain
LVQRDQPDVAAAVGALEIAAELVLDVARHGPLSAVPSLESALEVLGEPIPRFEFRRFSAAAAE